MNSDKRIWKGNPAIAFDGLVRKEIWLSFVIAIMCLAVMGVPVSADVSVTLTSITLDPEDSTGATTNAPGAWSTNTADPLSQVGVMSSGGVFLNQGAESGTLGEISIPLEPGINTFTLYGNHVFPGNAFYGAVLFFDGVPTPPQVAVYNSNGGLGDFLVQPASTIIMGGANGGHFFDVAPGTSVYIAPDGTKVEVVSFVINSMSSSVDEISFGGIGSDETFDTTAELILKVTPIPATIDINPDTLNVKSNGEWITAYIELPEGYDVADIDVSTILLEDEIPAEAYPTGIGDYDYDGIADLMVKFDRSVVQEILEPGEEVEITVTGEVAGTPFEGSDTIIVID
jgi:hypothetical protein